MPGQPSLDPPKNSTLYLSCLLGPLWCDNTGCDLKVFRDFTPTALCAAQIIELKN